MVTASVADVFSGREERDEQTESVDEEQDACQEGGKHCDQKPPVCVCVCVCD